MIVLDTNIISELHGRQFADRIFRWLDGRGIESLCLTTIVVAELRFGLELLPEGKRRQALALFLDKVEDEYAGRILQFSLEAAHRFGELVATRHKHGHSIETKDAMIAAICLSNGAALATRNTKDFAGLDLPLINPFEEL